jgi:hypothetical protein
MTGRVIAGRYNLQHPIGRGAMGVVWRARDQLLDRDVELLMGVMGMGPDRAIDLRKSLGDREHFSMPPYPGRDGDDTGDAGCPRACNHGLDLLRKVRKIEVTVAIDQARYRCGLKICRGF